MEDFILKFVSLLKNHSMIIHKVVGHISFTLGLLCFRRNKNRPFIELELSEFQNWSAYDSNEKALDPTGN
jgi:hypothetical protein